MGAFTNSLIFSLGECSSFPRYYYPDVSSSNLVYNEAYTEVYPALWGQSASFDQKQFQFSSLSPDNPFGLPDNKKQIAQIANLKSKVYWLERDKNSIALIVISSLAAAAFTALAILFAPATACLIGFSCAAGASAALTGVGAWLYVRNEQKIKSLRREIVPLSNKVARDLLPYLIQINVVRIVSSQVMKQLHPEHMPHSGLPRQISEDDSIEIIRSSNNYLDKIKADIQSGKSPEQAYEAFKIDVAYI